MASSMIPIDMATNAPGAATAAASARTESGRIASLDFIRGIAVLGILASNIVVFARPNEARRVLGLVHEVTWTEWLPWMVNYIFIDGKFRSMFAALFGVGIVVFIERARARSAPARWLQIRRLFWLALIGYAHFVFLFEGDILFEYAMLGMLAVWAVFWNPRLLLVLAMLLMTFESYMAGTGMWQDVATEKQLLAMPAGAKERAGYDSYWQGQRETVARESTVMAHGTYGDVLAYRFGDGKGWTDPLQSLPFVAFQYLPMMLIGAALYRLGFFSGSWSRTRMIGWGVAGIALSGVIALGMGLWLMQEHWRFDLNYFVFYGPTGILRLPMTLGYLAVLTALAPQIVPSRIGQRLTAAGRMALTNYLSMSLVMTVLFQGWGLGLYDRFDRLQQWGFLLLGIALMLGWSKPWLARYRFGPLEWAWRCLTYWRLFPLRRSAGTQA